MEGGKTGRRGEGVRRLEAADHDISKLLSRLERGKAAGRLCLAFAPENKQKHLLISLKNFVLYLMALKISLSIERFNNILQICTHPS